MTEGTSQVPSDLLRFVHGNLYFFSDREPNDLNPDPADVGIPPIPGFALNLIEVGPDGGPGAEGNNFALYTPLPGQPGFDTSGNFPGLMFKFISDAVPEPGSFSLLLAGAGLWGLSTLRRRHRA